MANYSKPFNFRNGVQVDNDNFVVDSAGRVGIGTTRPQEFLDIYGNSSGALRVYGVTKTVGLTTTDNLYAGIATVGVLTTTDLVNTGIITTAQLQVGNSPAVSNLIGYGFTAWITTASSTGIHTFGPVGIKTANPDYIFQIEENPLTSTGIGMTNGDIFASGIVSATTLYGSFVGNLTGVAASTTKLETSRDFSITGDLESSVVPFDGTANVSFASTLSASFSANTSGIITATKFVGVVTATEAGITTATITNANLTNADVGIGTFDDLRIDKSSAASLVITSTTNSSVSIGESVGAGNSSARMLYTPGAGTLNFTNFDVGDINFILHGGTGTGSTGNFAVRYDGADVLKTTYDGKLGVNRGGAVLEHNLDVGGDSILRGNAKVTGIMTVGSGSFEFTFGDGSSIPMPDTQNFGTLTGVSTFNDFVVGGTLGIGSMTIAEEDLFVAGSVGIGTTNDSNFLSGIESRLNVVGHINSISGLTIANNTGSSGIIAITTATDGSLQSDPRNIPSDLGSTVPNLEYGNFQIDSGTSSFITQNMTIVPTVGVTTVGFGSTNLGLISKYDHPAYGSQPKYLTKVGVNTYFARSIFDIGVGSTTMNSYFILPSLSQSDINIMGDLWNPSTSSTLTGHVQSKKVTPNGIPGGALIYNTTTDKVQVRSTASTFGDVSYSLLSTPQTTTSGTEFEFTDVPSWAKKITVMFLGVSLDGTQHYEIQLGTSSGYITSNYTSDSAAESGASDIASSSSIIIWSGNRDRSHYGQLQITKFSSSAYVWNGSFRSDATTGVVAYGGVTGISGTITKIKIFSNDNFDAGQINILYEG